MSTSGVKIQMNDPALAKLLSGPESAVAKQLAKMCVQIDRRAKQLCPVDTGRLRSSISWAIVPDGRSIAGVVGTDVEYAPYVEFGTVKMDAQPFLRPAFYAVTGRGM